MRCSAMPPRPGPSLAGCEKVTFRELVAEMAREDLKAAERDALVRRHGYKPFDHHE